MIELKELKEIGKFLKTHALKGEMNALVDIEPEFITEGNAIVVDVDGIYVPFYAESLRPKGTQSYLIKLEGVDSEEDAKPFVNKIMFALKSEIAPFLELDEDDIIDEEDLDGFLIIDSESRVKIGEIVRVDSSTENVLFVVMTDSGDEVYIPAVEDFIDEINEEKRMIMVSLPEGLIGLNAKTEKQ